jgi:hypothetical protein
MRTRIPLGNIPDGGPAGHDVTVTVTPAIGSGLCLCVCARAARARARARARHAVGTGTPMFDSDPGPRAGGPGLPGARRRRAANVRVSAASRCRSRYTAEAGPC